MTTRPAVILRRRPSAWRRPAMAAAVALVLLAVVAYLAISAYTTTLAVRAERRPLDRTPGEVGLSFEAVRFESPADRIPLAGWYVPSSGADRAVVLVHGLDRNRSARDGFEPELARAYVDRGFNVLMFDLRAHGESGGDHVGLGWQERDDVAGALTWLRGRGVAAGRVALHGTSFGGSTALLAAADRPDVAAVVADSAFADARDLFNAEIRRKTGLPPIFTPGIAFFGSVLYGLDLDAIPPVKAVARIAPRPILFIHGDADTRIPMDHSQRLRAASAGPRDGLWIVPGATHGRAYFAGPAVFLARVTDFVDAAVR